MKQWTDLKSHWSSLTTSDILTAIYLLLLSLTAITSNHLFSCFINSKPEGRKTAIGISTASTCNFYILYFFVYFDNQHL